MFLSLFLFRLLKVLALGLGRAGMGCGRFWGWAALLVSVVVGSSGLSQSGMQSGIVKRVNTDRVASNGMTAFEARLAMHQEEAWLSVASHLPDPATASGDKLETAGDVLRARRYPEDALDYYTAGLLRGGNQPRLLNKLGVTELGLRHTDRAKAYLKMALKRDKRDSEAWNNLGATEYMDGRMGAAVDAYRKAIKLKPGSAVFHGNLATALVERKDFDGARKEIAKALDIDPEFGAKRDGESGISAHVLAPEDWARYCFEMARVYASKAQIDLMLHQLAMASECGMDLREKMLEDSLLKAYVKDARVVLLMQNAKAMGKPTMASLGGATNALPAATVQ